MKKVLLSIVATTLCSAAFAGGLLTNTNQNVHFLRNPARDASTEIDAVYSNPAGLSFLENDGLTLSLNNQSAFQTRTITSTFAPFAANGGSATKEYEGVAKAFFIPSVQAAYKLDKWVFSGSFAVVGGGGTATFDRGLPSFESQVAANIAALSSAANIPTTYSLNSSLEGSQVIYGIQLGATYKINDYLSAYVGGRANIVKNGYEGYLRDVQISAKDNLTAYFTTAAAQLNGGAALLQSAIDGGYGDAPLSALATGNPTLAAMLPQLAGALGISPEEAAAKKVSETQNALLEKAATATAAAAGVNQLSALDMQVDCKQSGFGVSPILGFDFKYNKLNVGVKYEFKTNIVVENKTNKNTTGSTSFDDGVKTENDIPALLTAGVSYEVLPTLRLSAGYHYFFDKDAEMANNKQRELKSGTSEYIFGAEYDALKWLTISTGAQYADYGLGDGYMSDLSFNTDATTVGAGVAIHATDKLDINLAYLWSYYSTYTKNQTAYNNLPIAGKDEFTRTNRVFGIGLDYKF